MFNFQSIVHDTEEKGGHKIIHSDSFVELNPQMYRKEREREKARIFDRKETLHRHNNARWMGAGEGVTGLRRCWGWNPQQVGELKIAPSLEGIGSTSGLLSLIQSRRVGHERSPCAPIRGSRFNPHFSERSFPFQ